MDQTTARLPIISRRSAPIAPRWHRRSLFPPGDLAARWLAQANHLNRVKTERYRGENSGWGPAWSADGAWLLRATTGGRNLVGKATARRNHPRSETGPRA